MGIAGGIVGMGAAGGIGGRGKKLPLKPPGMVVAMAMLGGAASGICAGAAGSMAGGVAAGSAFLPPDRNC